MFNQYYITLHFKNFNELRTLLVARKQNKNTDTASLSTH